MVFNVVCIYKLLFAIFFITLLKKFNIFEYTICLIQLTSHANKTRYDLYYKDKVTIMEESYKGMIQIN